MLKEGERREHCEFVYVVLQSATAPFRRMDFTVPLERLHESSVRKRVEMGEQAGARREALGGT